MINVISQIVRNIIILSILALFFEMLLPKSELASFAKVVLGLLVLMVVLNPLLALFNGGVEPWEIYTAETNNSTSTANIISEGENLAQELDNNAVSSFQTSLAKQMAGMARLVEGVEAAQVDIVMAVSDEKSTLREVLVRLEISEADTQTVKNKVRESLMNFYDLNESQIKVETVLAEEGLSK